MLLLCPSRNCPHHKKKLRNLPALAYQFEALPIYLNKSTVTMSELYLQKLNTSDFGYNDTLGQ